MTALWLTFGATVLSLAGMAYAVRRLQQRERSAELDPLDYAPEVEAPPRAFTILMIGGETTEIF